MSFQERLGARSGAPGQRGRPRDAAGWDTWHGYVGGFVAVAACTAFSGLVARYLQLSDLVMINLISVIGVSVEFGIGPSLFTAALSALTFDFFFIPPVFAFAPSDLKSGITLVVMVAVAALISGLAEHARRQQRAVRARELVIETERLRNSLLSAVSHDLRTPLAAIFGAGTELLQDFTRLDQKEREELIESIVEEAARLDQLVTNLLDVARFDEGHPELRKRSEPLDEVIEAALARLRGRLGDRPVHSRVPQEIPMVPMDAILIQQVLVNLLENAMNYTSEGSPVEVEATHAGDHVVVEVRDRGPGVLVSETERVFDRFYRGSKQSQRDGGIGLGLTICRAIVHAHGGTISLGNREQGGAVARMTLPLHGGVPA